MRRGDIADPMTNITNGTERPDTGKEPRSVDASDPEPTRETAGGEGTTVDRQDGALVPSRVVHTDIAFVLLTITGIAALLPGVWGVVTGPGPGDIPAWAGLCITYGVVAAATGALATPLIIRMARSDREVLAVLRAHRPRSTVLPGAVSNRTLLRSLRALQPSAPTPRSVVWAMNEHGMELWQAGSAIPTLSVPWTSLAATSTDRMPQGRAVIAIAVLDLTDGHRLQLAFRRRFGGITLMGEERLQQVLEHVAELARTTTA